MSSDDVLAQVTRLRKMQDHPDCGADISLAVIAVCNAKNVVGLGNLAAHHPEVIDDLVDFAETMIADTEAWKIDEVMGERIEDEVL